MEPNIPHMAAWQQEKKRQKLRKKREERLINATAENQTMHTIWTIVSSVPYTDYTCPFLRPTALSAQHKRWKCSPFKYATYSACLYLKDVGDASYAIQQEGTVDSDKNMRVHLPTSIVLL